MRHLLAFAAGARAEVVSEAVRGASAHGSRTVAVARHAIPSARPVKPSRSVVVALTATRPMSTPAILATRARIASRCGPILGASQTSVKSRWTIRPPRARTRLTAWARKTFDAAPFHSGSEGG